MMMSAKKENLRSTTGIVKDSNTIQTIESMETLKPDDIVVIIHLDDYKESFEKMMKRIEKMDEKVSEQSVFLNENIKDHEKKGFLGRFRKG
jgi:hypothetical protein